MKSGLNQSQYSSTGVAPAEVSASPVHLSVHGRHAFADPCPPSLTSLPIEWVPTEIRVRYAETDQMGKVYYSNYLVWFEVGRTEYCRKRGFSYRDFERNNDAYLAVAEAKCRYHRPARYDDVIVIRTRIEAFRKRTVLFQYEISQKETEHLVATGNTLHVVLDAKGRPRTFPEAYAKYFK